MQVDGQPWFAKQGTPIPLTTPGEPPDPEVWSRELPVIRDEPEIADLGDGPVRVKGLRRHRYAMFFDRAHDGGIVRTGFPDIELHPDADGVNAHYFYIIPHVVGVDLTAVASAIT